MDNVIVYCPYCGEENITDAEFYRVRCFACDEIFINPKCTLELNGN